MSLQTPNEVGFIGHLSAGESAECVILVTVARQVTALLHTVEVMVQNTYGGGKKVQSSIKYTVGI